MCVIVCIREDKKPLLTELLKMEESNPDGAGIAWVDGNFVRWIKNIDAKQVNEIQNGIKPPYFIHFRLASVGGVSPLLCHPFPVTADAETAMTGKIKGRVIAHNGHWNAWQDTCLKAVIARNATFPDPPMSDSRAMAWLVHYYGSGILTLIDQKTVILSAVAGLKTFGTGWQQSKSGLLVSNTTWERSTFEYPYQPSARCFNQSRRDL
jgi:hypothetical protein